MKKKLLALLFILVAVFGITGLSACEDLLGGISNAESGESSSADSSSAEQKPATTTEGLEYALSDDGTYYTVSGIGTATDTDIVIPSTYNEKPVTSIGNRAFYDYDCSRLTSVTIPDGVTYIGEYAFCACNNLTSITIPDSATYISEYAFSGCSSLTSITIPDSVTYIREHAFSGCNSLTSVIIPNGVIRIGMYAFENCKKLTNVYYKGTATEWEKISIHSYGNDHLTSATRYYYGENQYWHYVDGVPTPW